MEAATREEITTKVRLLSSNWIAYGIAESARDYETMNVLNREHRELCRWLAEHGMPFNALEYSKDTLTFALPATIMATASM
jgi:hypothetical protein